MGISGRHRQSWGGDSSPHNYYFSFTWYNGRFQFETFHKLFHLPIILILCKLENHILCYSSLCVSVWYVRYCMCCGPMHTHVETRRGCWMSSSTRHSPRCLEKHLSLNQKFTILSAQLSRELPESIFPCPSTGVTGMENHAWISLYTECWRCKLRSSCLHSKCFYLLRRLLSTLL